MRVLLANKFHYARGGDCIASMATCRLLNGAGVPAAFFSMSHPLTESASYPLYQASEVNLSAGAAATIRAASRIFGRGDVRRAFSRALDEFRPDVVHLHNIHSYLSPVLGELAHRRGCRVVWTLHDYKLVCPAYTLRRGDGENCIDCLVKPASCVANRCMGAGTLRNFVAELEMMKWSRKRIEEFTDCFIAPSEFMRNMMVRGGFSRDRISVVPNFVSGEFISAIPESSSRSDAFLYCGRLSEEKGIATLIGAAIQAGVWLNIAGDGPMRGELERRYGGTDGIRFLGACGRKKVAALMAEAAALVVPSEWFENNPCSVAEALCCGTPVIASRIGGIPEMAGRGDGVLFEAGNAEELAGILMRFSRCNSFDNASIAARARSRYSEAIHIDKLLQIYNA